MAMREKLASFGKKLPNILRGIIVILVTAIVFIVVLYLITLVIRLVLG